MGYQKKRLLKKVAAPARFFFRLKQKIVRNELQQNRDLT
jgi:hypothetical protein